jgi:hypothetical protein
MILLHYFPVATHEYLPSFILYAACAAAPLAARLPPHLACSIPISPSLRTAAHQYHQHHSTDAAAAAAAAPHPCPVPRAAAASVRASSSPQPRCRR